MTLVKLQDTLDNGKCASTRLFKDGLDAFGKALNAEPEIRFYVDGSPGMASAATTVHLLERLIDEFSFKGAVKVVYAEAEAGSGAATTDKLALLFPELAPADIATAKLTYGTCADITFAAAGATLDAATTGITGADAKLDDDLLTAMNVTQVLRLQPYMATGAGEPAPNRAEQTGKDAIDLATKNDQLPLLPYAYAAAATPPVADDVWSWYTKTQTFDAELAKRTANAQELFTALAANKTAVLLPAEGIAEFGGTSSPGRDVLLNLALGALSYQQSQGSTVGPIVLVLLDELQAGSWTFLQSFHDNDVPAISKTLTGQYGPPLGPPKVTSAIKAVAADLATLYKQLQPASNLTIGKPGKAGWITTLVSGARAGQVVVIPIGPLPQQVRDALFATAGMPSVFTEPSAASLPVALGLPFLQLPPAGGDTTYPGAPALEKEVSPEALAAGTAAATARLGLGDVIATAGASYLTNVEAVGQFIADCQPGGGAQQEYFAGLGKYYGEDAHDRLKLALTLFQSVLPVAVGDLDLDTVLKDLTDNWVQKGESGSVDLLKALPKSNFATFFDDIVPGGLPVTAPGEDYIWQSADKKSVWIKPPDGSVSPPPAQTTAFGETFDITVQFTADDGPVESTVSCRLTKPLELPGAPWIGLEKPGFDLTVNEAGIPVRGGVVGTVKGTDLTLQVSYPVEAGKWAITGTVDTPVGIARVFAIAGGSNLLQMLPPPLDGLAGFGLKRVQVVYDTTAHEIDTMVFALGSPSPWQFVPGLAISIDPSIDATINQPRSVEKRTYLFDIGGTLAIPTGGTNTVTVSAKYPDFRLGATLTEGQIAIGDLLGLFGANVPINASVTTFALQTQPSIGQWSLDTAVEPTTGSTWPVPSAAENIFDIGALRFKAQGGQSGSLYAFTGSTVILPETKAIEVDVSATWATAAGWTFEASVVGDLTVGDLLTYLGWSADVDYKVGNLSLGVRTGGTGKDALGSGWHFTAALEEAAWIPFLPSLELSASVEVGNSWGDTTGPAGRIEVNLKGKDGAGILAKADITVWYSYGGTYAKEFGVKWGHLTATVVETTGENPTWVATLTLADETVGSVIEEMVSWLKGTKFSLDPPWDVLDKISLDGLSLVYTFDPADNSKNSIGITVPTGPIDLVFCRIDSIEVTYRKKSADEHAASGGTGDPDPGVMIQVNGFFPWNEGQDGGTGSLKPWDTSNPGEAPAPPGNGNKYLDLRMLAMGQHISVTGLAQSADVQAAITALWSLKPPDKPDPDALPNVTFDGSAGWLVGTDFGILKLDSGESDGGGGGNGNGGGGGEMLPALRGDTTVPDESGYFIAAQFVFADPVLYGLRISLAGKPAKILAGLDFQIMYRQVSPTVGVYQVELTLPDKMRHLTVGAYSITLPVIAVAVYTNGNFLIDIGFPWNADFSRSLTVSAIIPPGIPVTGSAGLYFGVLSSATTNKVPVTTIGSFNPVVVFGFGLQVGFGASVDYGILSAGFSVTVVGILEGVIGKFNPYKALSAGGDDSAQIQSSYYFWLQGTVGVVGLLYGTVDFAIIKADVNVEVKLLLQLTYESYRSITMTVLASVDVSVTVSIDLGLFSIHIHFSFSMQLKETFTIDNPGPAPWDAPGNAGVESTRPLGILRAPVERRITRLAGPAFEFDADQNQWTNLEAASQPVPLTGYVTAGLTMAADEWGSGSSDVCFVTMLSIDSMTPSDGSGGGAVANADISLAASPAWQSVGAGSPAAIDLEVTFAGGYSGPVTLTATAPAGCSATCAPSTLSATGSSTVTVTTTAAGGSYPITLTASDGTNTASTTVTLAVDSSFDVLCRGVLHWVLAYANDGPIKAADLDATTVTAQTLDHLLKDTLKSSKTNPTPITPEAVEAFLAAQFDLQLHLEAPAEQTDVTAAFFPAPPGLSIGVPSAGWNYTIGDFNSISDQGLSQLTDYFAQLAVQVSAETGAEETLAEELTGTTLSVGNWLFADYFLMLARQLVQALRAGLRDFKYTIEPGQTVGAIVHDVNTKAGETVYTAADLFTANSSHPLNGGKSLAAGVTVHAPANATLASIAADWRVNGTQLAGANALTASMLADGITLGYGTNTHKVVATDTLLSIAGTFGVNLAGLLGNGSVVNPDQSLTALLDSQTLLGPGAGVTVPVVPYRALEADSFTTIAALPAYGGAFGATELATANAGLSILRPAAEIDYNGKKYTVAALDCLGDAANFFGVSVATLLNAVPTLLTDADLIATAAAMTLPPFQYATKKDDTLDAVAASFGIAPGTLGDSVDPGTTDLFAIVDSGGQGTPYLDIPHLPGYAVGELIEEAQRTLAFQHASAMASRFFFHGLRLPTAGIVTPLQPGMWVHTDGGLSLPSSAGLYALTGQQFPIPAKIGGTTFEAATLSATDTWLTLYDGSGAKATSLSIAIDPTTPQGQADQLRVNALFDAEAYLPLVVGLTELGEGTVYTSHPAKFTLATSLDWQSAGPLNLTYGPAADPQALRIWELPDALVNLPDAPKRQNPRFAAKVARFDEATGATETSPIGTYGWATEIGFKVKRVSGTGIASAATADTYQVVGVADTDVVLLERLLAQASSDDVFERLIVGYAPDAAGAAPKGVQTDTTQPETNVTFGIAQVNLSTETAPPTNAAAALARAQGAPLPGLGLLNSNRTEFVQLLWEASISRNGGFYLYYYDAADKRGLPDRVFDDQGEATLTLLLIYADAGNRLANYVNALVTGEPIDPSQATVFAEADPPTDPMQQIPMPANASLGSLAYEYFSDVGDLAQANSTLPLAPDARIAVTEGTFEAPPGGIALQAIVDRFGIKDIPTLQAANPPGTLADPLTPFTAINLPALSLTPGVSAHTASLEDVAGFYGQDVTSLAAANAGVAPIFAAQSSVWITGGPMVRTANVAPGVEAVAAARPVPPVVSSNAAQFVATSFLLNQYSLLNCQVAENVWFTGSNFGVPIGPTTQPADPDSHDKIRMPRALAPGDDWEYRRSVPYSGFAQENSGSPYAGVGGLLQVAFDWQDLYGNTLPTDLSQPTPTTTPLNRPPLRVGYTDALIGLAQWPSVGSSYEVTAGSTGSGWRIVLTLAFDTSRFEGVLAIEATSATAVNVTFTDAVESVSATTPANYTLTGPNGSVAVTQVTLDSTGKIATLAVTLAPDEEYSLSVKGVKWQSSSTSFVGSGAFTLETPDPGSVTVPAAARSALHTYDRLEQQLKDPGKVAFAIESSLVEGAAAVPMDAQAGALLAWLFDGASSVQGYLKTVAAGVAPAPAPPLLALPGGDLTFAELNTDEVFELNTSFSITRLSGTVQGDLETTPGIRSTATVVAPAQAPLGSDSPNTYALDAFVASFESVLTVPGSGYRLKVATGVDRHKVSTASSGSILWAVRLGSSAISYTIVDDPITKLPKSTIFAPRPVSTTLWSKPAMIYEYQRGVGISATGSKVEFAGIDLDGWCRQLFAAVDTVLSPDYTAPLQIVFRRLGTGPHSYLDRLLTAKAELAQAASDLMSPVFVEGPATTEVTTAFLQSLLVRLSNAYAVRAGISYEAQVTADIGEDVPPELYGSVTNAQPKLMWTALGGPSQVIVQFNDQMTVGTGSESAADASNYTLTGGLTVSKVVASTDLTNFTLELSTGDAKAGTTEVTVASTVLSQDGQPLLTPLTATVVDAPPRQTPLTFTSPKLTLATGEQGLTFLLSAPDTVLGAGGEVVSWVNLDLEYQGTSIEHQIQQKLTPGTGDYVASSWLSFVIHDEPWPFNSYLGSLDVPMILRDYPAVPSLPSQTGTGTGSGDLANIRQWKYEFKYSLPFHYPQDRVYGDVQFNMAPPVEAMGGFTDAFADLAEFVTEYPAISADLQKYLAAVDVTTTDDDQVLTNANAAALSFVTLVENVAKKAAGGGLRFERPAPALVGDDLLIYSFTVDEGIISLDGDDALLVTLTGALPPGVGSAKLCIPGGYEAVAPPEPPAACGEPNTQCFVYTADGGATYLSAADGQKIADRTIELDGLDILQRQDALPSVYIKRNENLGCQTDFVYMTPPTHPTSPLYPTIDSSAELSIAAIGQTNPVPRTLGASFTALFAELLAANQTSPISVQLNVAYDYTLVDGLAPVELPVFMQPPMPVDVTAGATGPGSLAQMIADWSAAITTWFEAAEPLCHGKLWFDLLILSDLTQKPMPLLRLRKLYLPIDMVTGPKLACAG